MLPRAFLLGACFAVASLAASNDEPLAKVATYHLKQPRYAASAVTDGQAIYVVGGKDRGELLASAERIDPHTGESTLITDKLIPRFYGSAAWVGGKIFTFGGWTHGGTTDDPDPRVEMFDPATGKITFVAQMPKARAHMAAVVRQGRIYTIGGDFMSKGALIQTGTVEIYDPASDRWSEGPMMPSPREAQGVLVGDFIVVPGGFAANAELAKVEMFVPAENQWKALPDLRVRVSAGSVIFLGENVFVFGDYANLSQVLAYNLRDRSTRLLKPDYDGARHNAAVVLNNRIWVVGGTRDQEGGARDLIQVFELRNPPAPRAAK